MKRPLHPEGETGYNPGKDQGGPVKFIRKRIERLQKLQHERPQLAEIFVFYETLFRFLEGEKEPFLAVVPDAASRELKRREGFPLLTGAALRVEGEKAGDFLGRLIRVLKEKGREGQEELARLQGALEDGRIDPAGLLRACLDRDRRALREGAHRAEVAPALVEYVFDTALSYALQRAREEGLSAPVEGWQQGYCPLCGGAPSMGELTEEEGSRRLHCSVCAAAWSFPRLRCPACGSADPDVLEYFTAEGETGYRVDVCRACSSYLKVVDAREAGRDLPMDIEDVSTLHLDLLAQKEGFVKRA